MCGIPTVTARIHSLSGIAPAPRITVVGNMADVIQTGGATIGM
jgi:hypothetical protein